MKIIIDRELHQGSSEWHYLRKKKITATDACVIMGVSKWKTLSQLYEEKISDDINSYQNKYMQRGLELEEPARNNLMFEMGFRLSPAIAINGDFMASLDAISEDNTNICEIKCPGKVDHDIAIAGKVPDHYFPQLQHQMFVCDVQSMIYYSFDGSCGVYVIVPRDQKYIDDMVIKETEFLECLKNRTPPEPTFIDKNDSEWWNICHQYRTLKQKIDDDVKRLESFKQQLIDMSEKRNCKGAGISVTYIQRDGCVDYSKIPELKDVDLSKYKKAGSEYAKVSVCK